MSAEAQPSSSSSYLFGLRQNHDHVSESLSSIDHGGCPSSFECVEEADDYVGFVNEEGTVELPHGDWCGDGLYDVSLKSAKSRRNGTSLSHEGTLDRYRALLNDSRFQCLMEKFKDPDDKEISDIDTLRRLVRDQTRFKLTASQLERIAKGEQLKGLFGRPIGYDARQVWNNPLVYEALKSFDKNKGDTWNDLKNEIKEITGKEFTVDYIQRKVKQSRQGLLFDRDYITKPSTDEDSDDSSEQIDHLFINPKPSTLFTPDDQISDYSDYEEDEVERNLRLEENKMEHLREFVFEGADPDDPDSSQHIIARWLKHKNGLTHDQLVVKHPKWKGYVYRFTQYRGKKVCERVRYGCATCYDLRDKHRDMIGDRPCPIITYNIAGSFEMHPQYPPIPHFCEPIREVQVIAQFEAKKFRDQVPLIGTWPGCRRAWRRLQERELYRKYGKNADEIKTFMPSAVAIRASTIAQLSKLRKEGLLPPWVQRRRFKEPKSMFKIPYRGAKTYNSKIFDRNLKQKGQSAPPSTTQKILIQGLYDSEWKKLDAEHGVIQIALEKFNLKMDIIKEKKYRNIDLKIN